jgi:uncharacterized protein
MGQQENRTIIEKYYQSLAEGDFKTFASLHAEDVVFNLAGKTPVSGRFVGKTQCLSFVARRVSHALIKGEYRFARKWRLMAVDEERVVGIMQGGGVAKNGINYDQTYCQIFTIRDGKVSELHEFFDTVLAEAALFDNKLERAEREPEHPFEF